MAFISKCKLCGIVDLLNKDFTCKYCDNNKKREEIKSQEINKKLDDIFNALDKVGKLKKQSNITKY